MKINFAQSSCLFRDKIKKPKKTRKTEGGRKAKPEGNNISVADNIPKIFTEAFKVKYINH